MNRDPFYQAIVDRLEKVTDDKKFEHCAADLLRLEWPNLVPIPGGDDAGLDGAWSDDDIAGGLVVTTSPNVIRNVTKNLEMQLNKGGQRRKVLVATTKALSPRQCRNIEKRIDELNFNLAHHPYTQQAIADRLYHNSRWCLELLGISGAPPALSRIPKGLRPFRDLPLLHRGNEYQWIKNATGDRVVVGQPGVGKTYLLQEYVNSGNALFVTDDDMSRITNGIRDQQPSALIVEDAHQRLELIQELRRYRAFSGLDFNILADCWPASIDDVCSAMSVGPNSCVTLSRLSPEQTVDVLNAARIRRPNWLVAELIRQSGGNPGRAAMLAHICITDGAESIWEGSALASWVRTTFSKLVDERCIRVLATIAFGGKSGMRVDTVASILEYPVAQVLDWIAKLNLGGIVQDIGRGSFRVLPEPLRFVLVKQYFFDQSTPISVDDLIQSTNSYDSALRTVLGARSRGAAIATDALLRWLGGTHSDSLWAHFVQIDTAYAHLVMDRYPEKFEALSGPLLSMIPERAVPSLLKSAIGDIRRIHSTTDHPLRLIHDWIDSSPQGSGESVQRRKVLWVAVRDWLLRGGDTAVGAQAIASVISPHFDQSEMLAGKPVVSFRRGSVRADELKEIAGLWAEVIEVLRRLNLDEWKLMFEAVDNWVYWRHPSIAISDELKSIRKETAYTMLADLGAFAGNRPGILKEIQRRCGHIGLTLEVQIENEYLVLFPIDDFEVDWEVRRRQETEAVERLAREWCSQDPNDICTRLMGFVSEAIASGKPYPDYSEYCCAIIAVETRDAERWLASLRAVGAGSRHILPFLERTVNLRIGNWKEIAEDCLRSENSKSAAILTLLTCGDIEQGLLDEVYEASKAFPELVERLCMNGRLVDERISSLMSSADMRLANAVVQGLWHREPKGSIPDEIKPLWRRTVISSLNDDYDLCEMLRSDKTLAFDWLMDRAIDDSETHFRERNAFSVANEQLTDEERYRVLDNLDSENYCAADIVDALVGTSCRVYEYVLSLERLKRRHWFHCDVSQHPNGVSLRASRLTLDTRQAKSRRWHSKGQIPLGGGLYRLDTSLSWNNGRGWRPTTIVEFGK